VPNSCMVIFKLNHSVFVSNSGGATPGRAKSNDLAEELLPWLTKISINFINIAHELIYGYM